MKRTLAFLLCAILLLSCLPIVSAGAKDIGVETKFRMLLEDMELVQNVHRSDRYFFEQIGQYPAKDPEWVLIRGGLYDLSANGNIQYQYAAFGNKFLRANTNSAPFSLGYGVFDVKTNVFYDLVDAWDMNLNNLRDVWDDLSPTETYSPKDKSSENGMYVIGDADVDGEVTILDATRIQRCLAELDTNPWESFTATGADFVRGTVVAGATDYDRDGDTTVMDATRIQRNIADLPNNIGAKIISDEANWKFIDDDTITKAQLLTDRTALSDFSKQYTDSAPDKKYNDAYFKDHTLIGVYLRLSDMGWRVYLDGAKIDVNGTLTLDFTAKNEEAIEPHNEARFILVEISSAYIDDIKDVKVNIESVDESVSSPVYTEIPDESAQMTIPDTPANQGYRVLDTTSIPISAPNIYTLNLSSSPLKGFSSGKSYVMILRSRAGLESLLPGFDKEGKYNDAYFKNHAIVGMIAHDDGDDGHAEIGVTASKDNSLYVQASVVDPDYGGTIPTMYPIITPVWTFVQVQKSDVAQVRDIKLWHGNANNTDTIYTEIPRPYEQMEIPNQYWKQGYTGVGMSEELLPSSPTDFGFDGMPLDAADIGYILVLRTRAAFEKYFPGFDREKKYGDNFFKTYAVVAVIAQGTDYTSSAGIGLTATKGDALYVYGYTKEKYATDDDGTPVSQPTAPIVWTFRGIRQDDIASVTRVVSWGPSYPPYNTSVPYTVVDDYNPEAGTLSDTDAAYLITKPSDVSPTIERLFVDNKSASVTPDAHTVEMKSYLENFFYYSSNVIAMRVYQGSCEAKVTVDRVVRTDEKELTIDVTRLHYSNHEAPDVNWRIIYLRIENYGKDFDIKLNVQDKDTDSLIASIVKRSTAVPYDKDCYGGRFVDSVRAFRGDYDILGRKESDYAAFIDICGDLSDNKGFFAVVRSVDQLNYLFSADDLIPDDARAKYNEAYFKDKALVVLMYYGGDYIGSIDLSHLGVVGNTLYGEMIYTEPPWNEPSFNLYYDVQEVNRDDVKDVTSTGLWTLPLNECRYDFNSYYRQSDVPMRPIDLSGYTEVKAEKVFEYTSQHAGIYVDSSNYNSAGIVVTYNRDQFELMNGKIAGLTISDKDFDDYCYVSVSANGKYEGDTIAVRGFYLNSAKKWFTADADFRMYREDSDEPAPAEDQHWTNLIYRFKKSSVKNLRSIGYTQIWRTDCDYEYEINSDGDIEITKYIGFDENVIIPSEIGEKTVVAIGDNAFADNRIVKSVSIPNTVTTLGNSVFSQCLNLKAVYPAASITTLGDKVFYQCVKLSTVNLPNSITKMGKDVFRLCSALKSIDLPRNLPGVPEGVFYGCGNLTSFRYPDKPTYIGNNAFRQCASLTNLTVPDTVEEIGSYAFSNTGIAGVTIPESVKSIGNCAFYSCKKLEAINMSDTLESIGGYAFYACSALRSFALPAGVTRINYATFSYCTSLQSFSMQDNVTYIDTEAFSHCTALPQLRISSGVTEIAASAFEKCTSLKSLSIPRGVKKLGNKAAKDCTALERVTFAGEVYPTYLGVVIPPILNETIGESAFEGCTALTTVSMPDDIKKIGKRAFYGCIELVNFTLPASVTAIEEYTFANCQQIWTLNSYGDNTVSVKTVGDYAFLDCKSLEYVKFDNTLTSIGAAAFRDCSALSEVTLKENLKTIGTDAFLNCVALKKLTVPKSVTTISKGALGYNADEETNLYVKRDDFTIRGYAGSTAQTYAVGKGIPFEEIESD